MNNDPWTSPEMVQRLASTPPNAELMNFAEKEAAKDAGKRLLDIGCGAGCNAIPLAQAGWDVTGLDLSDPMLEAARQRAEQNNLKDQVHFKSASMDQLPVIGNAYDFIVAHGIWNLASSSTMFRKAVREAARSARPGAPLFVYTFSRSTLPETCKPVDGETFVFTEFADRPQCFLTEAQLIEEMKAAGFEQEPGQPITEYPQVPGLPKPAILEGIFRRS
jgi:2-polyprenyl-3-methyl-5-hydroxy-6-metoxy-1,4-benzoquinol methylase